jgi:hypothetical protein
MRKVTIILRFVGAIRESPYWLKVYDVLGYFRLHQKKAADLNYTFLLLGFYLRLCDLCALCGEFLLYGTIKYWIIFTIASFSPKPPAFVTRRRLAKGPSAKVLQGIPGETSSSMRNAVAANRA